MKDSYYYYTDKLTGEYKEVFDQIDLYIGTENPDEQTREERMGQLLDMFLTAQQSGKPVERIVGKNIQAFCKEFCADLNWKNQLWRVLDGMKSLAKFLLVMACIDFLFLFTDWADGVPVDFWRYESSLNLGGYLLGLLTAALVAFVSNFVVRRLMFRTGKVSIGVLKVITWIFAIAAFVLCMVLMFSEKTNVISYPVWIEAAVSAGYLVLYRILNRSRSKEDPRGRIKFSDLVNAEIDNTFGDDMEKAYNKASKRSVKKGKGELSRVAFLEKQEKRCRSREKFVCFYYVYPALIIAAAAAITGFLEGFEGAVDLLIFLGIMLVVQYALSMFFLKLDKKYTQNLRAWITEQNAK